MSGTRLRGPLALLCALLAGSSLLVAVDACTIVNGLTVPEDAAAQRETGASDAGSDGPIDPCMHAYPPPKPSAADTPTDLSILVAAKRFTLGTPVGSIPPGLDLDNACSCPPAVPDTCVGKKDHCDAVGGRDNAAGSLFNTLLGAPGPQKIDFDERINSGIRAGRNTILLGVDHFNGTNDDPDVSVSVYATVGLLDGSGNNVAPTFTDADRWALDARQFPVTQTFPRATTQGRHPRRPQARRKGRRLRRALGRAGLRGRARLEGRRHHGHASGRLPRRRPRRLHEVTGVIR